MELDPHERPDLFGELTPEDDARIAEIRRVIDVVGGVSGGVTGDGYSLACVAGIDADEAVRRLEGVAAEAPPSDVGTWTDEHELVLGLTTVPGGCVVWQEWGFGAQMSGVLKRLSVGTVAYGMYSNPKSGDQGTVARDGEWVNNDLFPGGGIDDDTEPGEMLVAFLCEDEPVAHCCAFVGLRPEDSRAFDGPPDVWIRLPQRNYGTWG